MGRQHGAQLGISIAALDMAPASTRSQATSKVLTEAGTSAVNGAHAYGTELVVQARSPTVSADDDLSPHGRKPEPGRMGALAGSPIQVNWVNFTYNLIRLV